jgi:hypothetical protein
VLPKRWAPDVKGVGLGVTGLQGSELEGASAGPTGLLPILSLVFGTGLDPDTTCTGVLTLGEALEAAYGTLLKVYQVARQAALCGRQKVRFLGPENTYQGYVAEVQEGELKPVEFLPSDTKGVAAVLTDDVKQLVEAYFPALTDTNSRYQAPEFGVERVVSTLRLPDKKPTLFSVYGTTGRRATGFEFFGPQNSALHRASARALELFRWLVRVLKAQFAEVAEFGFLVSVPSWAVRGTGAAATVAVTTGSAFRTNTPATRAYWGSGNTSGTALDVGRQPVDSVLEVLRGGGTESVRVAAGTLPVPSGEGSRPQVTAHNNVADVTLGTLRDHEEVFPRSVRSVPRKVPCDPSSGSFYAAVGQFLLRQRVFREALWLCTCLATGDERLRFHSSLLVIRAEAHRRKPKPDYRALLDLGRKLVAELKPPAGHDPATLQLHRSSGLARTFVLAA